MQIIPLIILSALGLLIQSGVYKIVYIEWMASKFKTSYFETLYLISMVCEKQALKLDPIYSIYIVLKASKLEFKENSNSYCIS